MSRDNQLIRQINIFNNDYITANDTFQYLKSFLNFSDFVLDVGSGSGLVAELISKIIGCNIKCIDVININKSYLPVVIFDGENIPYDDDTFSVVLSCFVLHHSQNPEKLINEMTRVSKSIVLIFEDIPITIFDRLLLKLHNLYSIIKYKSGKLEFHNIEQWEKIFKQNRLRLYRIIKIQKSRQLWNPVSRRLFILKKQKILKQRKFVERRNAVSQAVF